MSNELVCGKSQNKATVATELVVAKKQGVMNALASRLEVDPSKLMPMLKKTVFSTCKTDEEFMAMCIVANTYGLNPITKEIYAFPNKGTVVPVVGYDGWQKLANNNPSYDGCEFVEADDGSWCECRIYRKDRNHPIAMREYLSECKMETPPWQKYPRRMLRNKAFNQCARAAFGLSGIYDPDEAQRIKECTSEEQIKATATAKPSSLREALNIEPKAVSESPIEGEVVEVKE